MLQHILGLCPFLWLNTTSLYEYTTVCLPPHNFVDGHVGCFHSFLAIMKNDLMTICVQVFISTTVFRSLGYVPRSEIVGPCSNSV